VVTNPEKLLKQRGFAEMQQRSHAQVPAPPGGRFDALPVGPALRPDGLGSDPTLPFGIVSR
jgi:hypothetical protein